MVDPHVVYYMTYRMSYSVAIEHHCDSDIVETMQPRESKLMVVHAKAQADPA